ncbi:aspartate aminotransferase family protein [Mesorhizobium sp. M6A.T.Cr.TU.017.01.1.1]|uniref:pyridoxal phosphate-dependent decarboxylase family protein n=1 Tax=Mesorhizobium sp. M6A.T.Cr.TU.017.01.1.1 TaxID=2496774 RepID=UPI000FD3C59A|nr:aminotransferase class V-fold PLP-dependent enzyme [Mesorhizobium sp. M6A.T.Cr.TU.017.01.1.1]RUU97594.1 aspartate aminotransferase family protein [Mesorhizobium sp. M6A.T.Cr.TU.017.01.1.1]
MKKHTPFPENGLEEAAIWQSMEYARQGDVDWRGGRLPGFYVHFANDDVDRVGKIALEKFHATNALGLSAFPSIKKFESEVVEWALSLFHANGGAASITSGGTESIFIAMKTAREWAKANRPEVTKPNMLLSHSAHPAFDKAAKYLGLDVVRILPRADFKTDIDALNVALDDQTIIIAGSAPQFTIGVFDQIEELAAIASSRNVWFHTDACVGGFFSPFAEQNGHPIPPWDFRVEGVKSISADLHKYGFAPKGASIVAFSDAGYQRYQVFDFDNWSRGRYVTSTFAGTRSGASIAAAWAVMRFLGNQGYRKIADQIWQVREKLMRDIPAIEGLFVYGEPELTVMSYGSKSLDVADIAAGLAAKGWHTVAPSPNPPAINLGILSLAFGEVVDAYLADLWQVVAQLRAGDNSFDRSLVGTYGAR